MTIGAGIAVLAFWSFVAIVAVASIWDGMRKREAKHETLRRMIESGQPVDQALKDELLGDNKHLARDLRTYLRVSGFIVLFVAPGLALLGLLVSLDADESLFPMLGVAALVGCVAIGLLVASGLVEPSAGDLRTSLRVSGFIVLFVAPGLALLGLLVSLDADESLFPMLGVAALVGCVAIGLLVASGLVERSHEEDGDSA